MSATKKNRAPAARPVALLVLGMHRSGTSVLTRVLSLLGADLPAKLLPANEGNETGYWESEDLCKLQEDLLISVNLTWDKWSPFPSSWYETPAALDYQRRALEILRRDLTGSQMFVLKDPRMSLLVPFWIAVLEKFGADPVFIISVRNPLEVAGSLANRDHYPPQKSMLLWLRYMLDAQRHTTGMRRCHVAYEDLLTNWRAVVDHISRKTSIIWPKPIEEVSAEIDSLVSTDLRHHRIEPGSLNSDPVANEWVRDAYAAAVAAARGDENTLVETNNRINAEFESAISLFDPLITEQQTAVRSLRQQLDAKVSDAVIENKKVEDTKAIRDSADWFFNADYYLDTNPDVAELRTDPLIHFQELGWKQGRSPHPLFDIAFYLQSNPDVANSGLNPIVHFLSYGCSEGRNPNRFFDIGFYHQNNPDVAASGMNSLRHYIEQSEQDRIDPSPLFDGRQYLKLHPEIRKFGLDPLSYYLWRGIYEGHSPFPTESPMTTLLCDRSLFADDSTVTIMDETENPALNQRLLAKGI